jgi:hemerythrin
MMLIFMDANHENQDARGHFSAEEAMMAAAGFPGLAQHRIQHDNLTKRVEEFEARFERGERTVNPRLLSLPRDWAPPATFQDADKEYRPWINGRGVR